MEKALSQEERIRRAEEIYSRRRYENRNRNYQPAAKISKYEEKNEVVAKKKTIRKMLIQIFVCTLIYLSIYTIQHSNQIFSNDVMNKTKEILSYDISLQALYNQYLKYIENIPNKLNQTLNITNNFEETKNNEMLNTENIEQNGNTENSETDNSISNTENLEAENTETMAIGGVEIEPVEVEKSQEELDIEYVKQNVNIIWPLNGVITSRFGPRTPTEIVSANHCGLDIAGNIGTDIICAMDGTVTLSSSEGDYGKHIKVENGEITTLYAHCSKLLVQEGDVVTQGQKIAEVGETGKATGPHLHFEIRRENRFINPEEIL